MAQPKEKGGTVPHAIETPLNNSQLGLYFRMRLGLPADVPIRSEHLHKYGRTDVDFFKVDNETYYMSFAAPGPTRNG